MLHCYLDSLWALTWCLLHSRGLTKSLFSFDVGQLTHWEDKQKWSTCYDFSANCSTCQCGVRASTEVAGDMDEVVSVPVGVHPEPVCGTLVDFSPLLVVGVTEVAAAILGLGFLRIITRLHPDPWCCLGKLTAEGLESGIDQPLNQTLWTRCLFEAGEGSALLAVFFTVQGNQMDISVSLHPVQGRKEPGPTGNTGSVLGTGNTAISCLQNGKPGSIIWKNFWIPLLREM